jgi:alkaline phosphatase
MKRLMHTSALALSAALSAALTMALPAIATAQTIYPIDRADILAGSKFDFKVEFPGNPAQGDVKVLINGRDAAEVLGKPASFVAKEDGLDHSAYWIRDVSIATSGPFVVDARGGEKASKVTWSVYATPTERKAKNVILFVGDGLSIAHRTPPECCRRASRRANTAAILPSTTCRIWR